MASAPAATSVATGLVKVEAAGQKLSCPNVLADGDAKFATLDGDRGEVSGGIKVTCLVENVVGGQQGLADEAWRAGLFPGQQRHCRRGRPCSVRLGLDEADDEGGLHRSWAWRLSSARRFSGDKTGFKEEVLRRVAGDGASSGVRTISAPRDRSSR